MAGTKRIEQKVRTREAIKVAAHELFRAHGFDTVTLRMVASKAGVSTGAVYNCFADKAALYEAATGSKAPDIEQFLIRVSDAGVTAKSDLERATALEQLGLEADRLRKAIKGHHS